MAGRPAEGRLPTCQSRVEKVQAGLAPEPPGIDHGPGAASRRRTPARSGRRDPADVAAEFLRKGLAPGPVLVSDLEAKARAAGLLVDAQRITHAKPFKSAKKSLGIKSVRNGFGSKGEWRWLLETPSTPPVAAPASVPARRIPSGWVEGVARLHHHRPPRDIPAHRWRQFLGECNVFLTSTVNWAERAAALGWDAVALFGCRSHRPLDHLGSAGLLWVINGGRLIELHRDWAVYELAENGSPRVFERRRLGATNVKLPWVEPEATQPNWARSSKR